MSTVVSRRAVMAGLIAGAMGALLPGCGAGRTGMGAIKAESLAGRRVVLPGDFDRAVYHHETDADTTIILSDVSVDALLLGEVERGQILYMQMLWLPKAGQTPMDASATNLSLRHIVVSGGELGIYGGAGYAQPDGAPGGRTFGLTIRDSTLRLLEATDGFVDPLTPSRVTGDVDAVRDERSARRYRIALSQFITDRMGKPRLL
jgi:hypothetical protein